MRTVCHGPVLGMVCPLVLAYYGPSMCVEYGKHGRAMTAFLDGGSPKHASLVPPSLEIRQAVSEPFVRSIVSFICTASIQDVSFIEHTPVINHNG